MYTLSDAIARVRLLLDDSATSHRVAPDDLSYQVDGIRTVFSASNRNLLTGVKYSKDGGSLTAVTPTDAAFGIVTISPAPSATLELYYYYMQFVDSEVEAFVDQALSEMNYTQTDLATIPDALFSAMAHFGTAYAIQVLMDRYAKQYDSTVEGQSYSKSAIFLAYEKAYKSHLTDAKAARGEYWGNQSRSNKPAWGKTSQAYTGNCNKPRR